MLSSKKILLLLKFLAISLLLEHMEVVYLHWEEECSFLIQNFRIMLQALVEPFILQTAQLQLTP